MVIPLGQRDKPKRPDLGPLRGKTVLVVDDEDDIRKLVALMLKGRGVSCITTGTADDALDILAERASEISVVLLDLSVPNAGDRPALDRLRQEHPNTPVIIMTGMSCKEAPSGHSADPLVGYLRKPFRPAALYDALAQRGKMADQKRKRSRRDSGGRTGGEKRRRKV